jgi:protein TonB
MRRKIDIVAIAISLIVHIILAFLFRDFIFQPAKFSILNGVSSIEVNLIAAPREEKTEKIELKNEPFLIKEKQELFQPEALSDSETVSKEALTGEALKAIEVAPNKPVAKSRKILKENFSPKKMSLSAKTISKDSQPEAGSSLTGKDSETLIEKNQGSPVVAKPDYLRNPPPVYPETSRRLKEEGTVWLKTSVDAKGRAAQIDILKSSGFERLDRAAKDSVKKWHFKPAQLAGLKVESIVEIPIIFQLK